MRFWALSLYTACAIAVGVVDDVHTPVELLVLAAKDPNVTELKPLIMNSVGSSSDTDEVQRRDNPLAGLLARQSCPSGYGECNNPAGRCCPLGGRCCSGRGCCNAGYWCYSTGCCKLSEKGCEGNSCCPVGASCCSGGGCCAAGDYCAVADGRRGCCPNGKICSGSGNSQCSSAGYSRCSGENFCCPTGDQCYRDDAGQPRCRSTSGTGSTTTRPANPDPTTSQTPTTQNPNTATGAGTATGASRITSTAVIPSPTAPAGSSIIEIGANDPRITYRGSWQSTTSSCNSTGQSRMATDSYSSFTVDFQGSAVYLSVATNNAWYTVTVGGETTDFGTSSSTVAPSNCTLSFSQTGLSSSLHTMVVYVYGASMASSSTAPWSFEFNKLVVTASNSALGSGTGTAGASQSTITGGITNAASSLFDLRTLQEASVYAAFAITSFLFQL